jgi:hypothetical protein
MIIIYPYRFPKILPDKVTLEDHLNGFDQNLDNSVLRHIDNYCVINNNRIIVNYHQVLESQIQDRYPNLDFNFDLTNVISRVWNPLLKYTQHPELQYKNFVCSFNGGDHVGRKLLTAALKRFGYFNSDTCSKNFTHSTDVLDGHVSDYTNNMHRFYRKFFISAECENFFQTAYSFGHVQFDHANNIYNLEHQLTQSFLHIVSETRATSYYPFVTEKFLYSIVTRGLFLAYAQPEWHTHLEKYYGFKLYTKLFDYRFDSIQNPVERLIELMTMISKFSVLSADDWRDLYEMESDTIEFNYDHYFSEDYVKCLAKYAQTV